MLKTMRFSKKVFVGRTVKEKEKEIRLVVLRA